MLENGQIIVHFLAWEVIINRGTVYKHIANKLSGCNVGF